MNKDYIKELFEENKEAFIDSELDIENPQDLEDVMISYITSNMQYDFDVDIDSDKLFSNTVEKDEISYDEEIEK
ncbi:MAG: hypothetical protein J6D28_01040 [Bacilli bacterium]|nr:hypothetical protein [Bacilli bacterium]